MAIELAGAGTCVMERVGLVLPVRYNCSMIQSVWTNPVAAAAPVDKILADCPSLEYTAIH